MDPSTRSQLWGLLSFMLSLHQGVSLGSSALVLAFLTCTFLTAGGTVHPGSTGHGAPVQQSLCAQGLGCSKLPGQCSEAGEGVGPGAQQGCVQQVRGLPETKVLGGAKSPHHLSKGAPKSQTYTFSTNTIKWKDGAAGQTLSYIQPKFNPIWSPRHY